MNKIKTGYSLRLILGATVASAAFLALILHYFFPDMPGNQFVSSLVFIPHIALFIASIVLYLHTPTNYKRIVLWFFFAVAALSINGINFYYFIYIKHYSTSTIPFVLFLFYWVPFIIWLTAATVCLSKLLVSKILSVKRFTKIILAFFVFNFILMFLFFSALKEEFFVFSGVILSQAFACTYKLVLFDLAIFCLICAEDIGMITLLSGMAMLISADFLFNYSSVAKINSILIYGELAWLLATFIMFLGVLLIIRRKSYDIEYSFRKTNAIKNHLILWTFGVSTTSFMLFFVAAYAFSLIDKVIFAGLPFFIMTYSVILVILSVIMGKYFESPFKILASNIKKNRW